jgi:hypothetical protein
MHKGNQDNQLEKIDKRKFGNDLKNLKSIFIQMSMKLIIKNCPMKTYLNILLTCKKILRNMKKKGFQEENSKNG